MSFTDYTPLQPRTVGATSVYSDLDLRDPFISPLTKDVVPLLDLYAVKASVRNLVLTNFYEGLFDPFRGGNVRALLFENATTFTAMSIQKEITRVLLENEPRINVTNVTVVDNADNNAYQITISFNVIAINVSTTVNFSLVRIR